MTDVKTVIEGLEEIRDNLIPALAKMYGSGFSSVFACEKVIGRRCVDRFLIEEIFAGNGCPESQCH